MKRIGETRSETKAAVEVALSVAPEPVALVKALSNGSDIGLQWLDC